MRDRLPVKLYRTAVRFERAGNDLDERGLARAVLANERVDFACTQLKRSASERVHTHVGHGDVAGLEQRTLSRSLNLQASFIRKLFFISDDDDE